MQVVPLHLDHLARLDPPLTLPSEALTGLVDGGPAFAGLVGQDVVGCAGLVMTGAGKAVAWALFSRSVKRHRAAVFRSVCRNLGRLEREYGLTLITTSAQSRSPTSQQWLERLGFARAGEPDGRGLIRYERWVSK